MPNGAESAPVHGDDSLHVGAWRVDFPLYRLANGDRTVKLEPKAAALLRYLAERPGQVASREVLLAAVWPGVVVGDDSLTQAMIKLRKALGDGADSQAYIETIPKGGYRLVAPVYRPEPAPVDSVAGTGAASAREGFVATAPLPDRREKRRKPVALAAAVALSLAAAWIGWMVYERSLATPATASAEESRAAQPTIRIVAFQAIGDDAQAVLLARGMTADLITDLSKVFGLSVIADTVPADQPGSAAGLDAASAQYLVSGSVQRIEDRVRLHIHLADARTGKQLWSERYDRSATSLFELQDDLVPRLLRVVPAKVTEAELRRVASHHTRNLEAYELYQRGQMALLVRQQEENEVAREMFRGAIALDPSFALAYSALAQTYAADHRNQWTENRAAALERAFDLARTAHGINPDVRQTYWVLALVHLERGQHKEALRQLETALRLYPSFADGYALMGGIYAYMGQPAQSLALLRTAIRLNPDAGYLYYLILGRAHFGLGDLQAARIALERAIDRNPVSLEARVYAAATYVASGDRTTAAWEGEEIRALQPDFSTRTWLATHPLRDAQTRDRLETALAQLGF